MSSFVTVGRIYIDKDGAGRLYLKKRVMEVLDFKHGEEVRVEVLPEENRIIVTKL
jgi:hypothetical protein